MQSLKLFIGDPWGLISRNVAVQLLSEWSMQLLVSLEFCLAVWFPSGNKAAGTVQTTGRPKGIGPRGLNWDSKYCADSLNAFSLSTSFFISIYLCVRACPAAVMSFCAHNRQLLVHLFCIAGAAKSVWLLPSRYIQFKKYNRSQRRGSRPARGFWSGGRLLNEQHSFF